MSSSEMREKVIHWFNSGQTHKLSAPFQSGDNYINLNLLNKLTEKTKEIEKFVNFEVLSSHNASKKIGEKLLELAIKLPWISLHFWQPRAITLRCISTAWASKDWLGVAFCTLKLLLKMQSLEESVNHVISQKFLWGLSGKYARTNN